MYCTDEQKASLKRCLEDAKWRSKMKPLLEKIILDNIGVCSDIKGVCYQKEIISMFDEITKE